MIGLAGSVSLSGSMALIGAREDDDNGDDSGSAYLVDCTSGTCIQSDKLLATDGLTGDQFGHATSLSGNMALIGASLGDGNATNSGAVYLFDCTNGTCTQSAKLTASDGAVDDSFGGTSVSLANNMALIGAIGDDALGNNSGSAYLFDCTSLPCTQSDKFTAGDIDINDQFGASVSFFGSTALIGSYLDDDNGTDSGSAYLFNCASLPCTQSSKLLPIDGDAGDNFGGSVSLSGNMALIGAREDEDNGARSGSAYLFDCTSLPCTQAAKLLASDGAGLDLFGQGVSLSGSTALIGSFLDDDNGDNSGSAYLFDCASLPCHRNHQIYRE